MQDLLRILREADPASPYAVPLDVLLLINQKPGAAEALFATPQAVLSSLAAAALVAQHKLLKSQADQANLSLKQATKVRIEGTHCKTWL